MSTASKIEWTDKLDEHYGRRCTVATQVIRYDGASFDNVEPDA